MPNESDPTEAFEESVKQTFSSLKEFVTKPYKWLPGIKALFLWIKQYLREANALRKELKFPHPLETLKLTIIALIATVIMMGVVSGIDAIYFQLLAKPYLERIKKAQIAWIEVFVQIGMVQSSLHDLMFDHGRWNLICSHPWYTTFLGTSQLFASIDHKVFTEIVSARQMNLRTFNYTDMILLLLHHYPNFSLVHKQASLIACLGSVGICHQCTLI